MAKKRATKSKSTGNKKIGAIAKKAKAIYAKAGKKSRKAWGAAMKKAAKLV